MECTRCGKENESKDFSLCEKCRSSKRIEYRAKYDRRKAEGICVRCKNKADEGSSLCVSCKKKLTKDSIEARKMLKNAGICPYCKTENIYLNEKRCFNCAEKSRNEYLAKKEIKLAQQRDLQRRRKENGLCTRCGKPNDCTTVRCSKCKTYMKKYDKKKRNPDMLPRSDWVAYGLCYTCGKPIDTDKKICSKCYQNNNMIAHPEVYISRNEEWARLNSLIFEETKANARKRNDIRAARKTTKADN